jgi:hypothetical protein
VRDAVALRGHGARELLALADDDVGAPCPDHLQQIRQRGAGGDAAEALGHHARVPRAAAELCGGGDDAQDLVLGRIGAAAELEPHLPGDRPPRARTDHAHVVAVARAGACERHQGEEVAGVARGRHEDAHDGSLSALAAAAKPAGGGRSGVVHPSNGGC